MREVERGDDRRAKDSRTREDSRVCASCASAGACSSVSQRGGSLVSEPVVVSGSGSSARFALAVFISLFRSK